MTRSLLGLILGASLAPGLGLAAIAGAHAEDLTMPYAGAPAGRTEARLGIDQLRLFKGADWLKGWTCSDRRNVEVRVGGQVLRVSPDKLAALQIPRDEVGTSCAGDPVRAEYVGIRMGPDTAPAIVARYAPESNLIGLIAAARTQARCTSGPKADLETCVVNRDSDPAIVVLDRTGPVDEFDNPPALICLPKAKPGCFQMQVHPSGIVAVVPITTIGGQTAPDLRRQQIKLAEAITSALADPAATAAFDAGRFAPTNAPTGERMLALPVDGKGAARGDLLAYRTCGAKAPATLHIGGTEMTVPLAMLRQIRFGPTTRSQTDQRRTIDMAASCPDAPLYLRSAYIADGDTGVVLNGRGRAIKPEVQSVIDDLRKGECAPASDTVLTCRSGTGDRVLHTTGSSSLRLDALCTGPGERQTCQMLGESDLGFSYSVPLGAEALPAKAVQDKLMQAYRLVRGLAPHSAQAARLTTQ